MEIYMKLSINKILIIGEDVICHEIKRIIENSCGKNTVATIDIHDPEIKNLKKQSQWDDHFALQEAVNKFSWWKDYFIVLALTQNDSILAMRINQITYTLKAPWIHGAIDGPFLFIGPTFNARSGPCYHCFEQRITMNLREHASYQHYKDDGPDHATSTKSPIVHVLSAYLALEVINQYFFKTSFTRSKALSIYLPTMEICFHEVLQLSGCFINEIPNS